MNFSEFTNKNIKEIFDSLKASPAGLTAAQAADRTRTYGQNAVSQKGNKAWDILLRQFRSPFFYLLFVAGVISFFIGERIDSTIIVTFVAINVMIGFFQEYRAEKAIVLLKRLIPQKATVLRDGKRQDIEKNQLVPGDIVFVEPGDIIPAELRVVQTKDFLIDESALTGESVPVSKHADALANEEKEIFKASNILFTGTSVISGTATGVVLAIGNDTALGGIIALVAVTDHQSTYEKGLLYFSQLILKIVTATIVILFIVNLLMRGTSNLLEFSLFCIALVISILPEALPAIVILALSRGSIKMAQHSVVVKRLSAIEDLGNIEILCSDKTGTITQNKLSLEKIVSADKDTSLLYALIDSQAQQPSSRTNPFDTAFIERSDKALLEKAKRFTIISELPFDSFRMKTSYLAENTKKERFLIVKGAPEIMLRECSTLAPGFEKKELLEDFTRQGQEGKRVLAIAVKKFSGESISSKDEKGLYFLGYFVFSDPLKSTAREAIRLAKKMQVQIKIITGDSKEVSGFVARQVGLLTSTDQVMLGQDLERMTPDAFDQACEAHAVFARVSPDTKHKIIQSLQKKYEVGFLGEGINDAPALKTADVGIAVAGACDIAREAADVVLLHKDLRVIIDGVKHGRTIFANINKYIKCALASNFGNFYSIAIISLFINFLPMLPVQILLGNLLSDFPLIALTTDSVDVDELRKPKMYQLHMVLPLIITLALVSTVFDFLFFLIFYRQQPGMIQTLWFVESILTEIVLIFIIRTRYRFWKAKKPGFWLACFTVIDAAIILALPFLVIGHELFHFVTPSFSGLVVVMLLVVGYFAASEIAKLVYFHYWRPKKTAPST